MGIDNVAHLVDLTSGKNIWLASQKFGSWSYSINEDIAEDLQDFLEYIPRFADLKILTWDDLDDDLDFDRLKCEVPTSLRRFLDWLSRPFKQKKLCTLDAQLRQKITELEEQMMWSGVTNSSSPDIENLCKPIDISAGKELLESKLEAISKQRSLLQGKTDKLALAEHLTRAAIENVEIAEYGIGQIMVQSACSEFHPAIFRLIKVGSTSVLMDECRIMNGKPNNPDARTRKTMSKRDFLELRKPTPYELEMLGDYWT